MRSGGKRPRTAAKETPPDLPRHLENIQEILGYVVSSRVLDAQDYQVAQMRKIVFIVAIRRDSRRQRFEWPKPLGKRSLSAVLDPPVRTDKPGRLPKSERPKKLARMAMSKIWAQGVDPCKVPCDIDVGCSERYLTWKVGVAPTLCRARGGSGGFWLSSRGRKTTLRELMRITSINPEELQGWEACCTGPQLGQMLGNSVPVPLILAVLRNALLASGLLTQSRSNATWMLSRLVGCTGHAVFLGYLLQ